MRRWTLLPPLGVTRVGRPRSLWNDRSSEADFLSLSFISAILFTSDFMQASEQGVEPLEPPRERKRKIHATFCPNERTQRSITSPCACGMNDPVVKTTWQKKPVALILPCDALFWENAAVADEEAEEAESGDDDTGGGRGISVTPGDDDEAGGGDCRRRRPLRRMRPRRTVLYYRVPYQINTFNPMLC